LDQGAKTSRRNGFFDDALGRYGYLPNPDSETPGLPVGFLAAADSGVKEKTFSADCGAGKMDDSGNSRCGHDYGAWLKEDEKSALLEYLKGL
jgi:hypothetical protein